LTAILPVVWSKNSNEAATVDDFAEINYMAKEKLAKTSKPGA
jgi:hypothetical protein